MKCLIVLSLLSFSAHADLRMDQDDIAPFTYTNYPLNGFIKDYSKVMGVNVSYASDLVREKDVVNLKLNVKMKKEDFKRLFYSMLDTFEISTLEDGSVVWLDKTRDMRFLPLNVYTDNTYPKNASYITFIHKLKYPISRDVANNLRPFLSRYARVIDASDARTIILNEKGDNISRLLEIIRFVDTEQAYQHVLNFKPEVDPDADNPLKGKIIELEADKKILEKKYMDLKEEQKS